MKLALGTVQFGLAYGLMGRGQAVPEEDARAILEAAAASGVDTLDTAAAYGDIEPRLAGLCRGLSFSVISKIPALPPSLEAGQVADWALASARQSRHRLGGLLSALMFHNADDLLQGAGADVWRAVSSWAQSEGVKLGVSCYAPQTLLEIRALYGVELAQLPGNAFDQRVSAAFPAPLNRCDIHLRSAFLQGVLLAPLDQARVLLPQAAAALERWHGWRTQAGLSALQACLSIVKGFTSVSSVVVGVDGLAQFQEIAEAWEQARPLTAGELGEENLDIIDPRRWRKEKG